jgi:hypothetical protein
MSSLGQSLRYSQIVFLFKLCNYIEYLKADIKGRKKDGAARMSRMYYKNRSPEFSTSCFCISGVR